VQAQGLRYRVLRRGRHRACATECFGEAGTRPALQIALVEAGTMAVAVVFVNFHSYQNTPTKRSTEGGYV
jgi:hypothetical protein